MTRTTLLDCTVLVGSDLDPVPGGITIVDGLIEDVGAHVQAQPGDLVHRLGGATVLPGLIDSHCHLIYRDVADPYDIELRRSLAEATIDAVYNAGQLLRSGFTTVRDVGSRGNIGVTLRRAVEAGDVLGPRIQAAGQIISAPGGLGDFQPSHMFDGHTYHSALAVQIVGPDQARAVVRRQLKDGADWIKVGVSGTGFNPLCPAERNGLSDSEFEAVIDEARGQGVPVAAHAESAHSVEIAARLGADTIEHGIYIDDRSLEFMVSNNVTLSPTLSMYRAFVTRGESMGIPASIVDGHRRTHEHHAKSVQRAFEAGVRIVAGGDAGLRHFPQGSCAEEAASYVDLIGMSPREALKTLTVNPAQLMGLAGEVGSIGVGMRADLLAVIGDPLRDVSVLQRPECKRLVLQAGVVVSDATR
jgi:imidazolonepropionase-like amidohydrolase